MKLKYRILEKLHNVSVPYWGSLYFNCKQSFYNALYGLVSVPYWGSLYFNVND